MFQCLQEAVLWFIDSCLVDAYFSTFYLYRFVTLYCLILFVHQILQHQELSMITLNQFAQNSLNWLYFLSYVSWKYFLHCFY